MNAPRDAVLDRPPYDRTTRALTFVVSGLPISQGSKSGFVNPRSGRVQLVESSKKLKPWRTEVARVIRGAILRSLRPTVDGFPLLGPLAVDLVFTMKRPTSAPKKRKTWPTVYPDVDKLARAILDAGTSAGAWVDDAQVVDLHAAKVYPNEAPGALTQPGLLAVIYLVGVQPSTPAGEQPEITL